MTLRNGSVTNRTGALRVYLYDDANTNAVLDAGEAFITQTPTVTEARHGLNWTNAADACGNPDGDGLINLYEYWCRTAPQTVDGSQYAISDSTLAGEEKVFCARKM